MLKNVHTRNNSCFIVTKANNYRKILYIKCVSFFSTTLVQNIFFCSKYLACSAWDAHRNACILWKLNQLNNSSYNFPYQISWKFSPGFSAVTCVKIESHFNRHFTQMWVHLQTLRLITMILFNEKNVTNIYIGSSADDH